MTDNLEPQSSDGVQSGPPAPQARALPDPQLRGFMLPAGTPGSQGYGPGPRKRFSALARAAQVSGIVQAVVVLLVLGVLGILFVVEFTMAGERAVSNAAVAGILVVCAVLAVIPVILGHAASHQLRRTGDEGTGAARAGLGLGYISTVLVMSGFLVLWLTGGLAGP